jgi:hypothetical protein
LGKNVYLSLLIDEKRHTYPAVPWAYVDINDVKHSQIDDLCNQLADFIYEKFRQDIEGVAKKLRELSCAYPDGNRG